MKIDLSELKNRLRAELEELMPDVLPRIDLELEGGEAAAQTAATYVGALEKGGRAGGDQAAVQVSELRHGVR